jgi:glycosyltransferase involved in cell wall biosynthesis
MTVYGMLSTFPPTQCGLATFAAALADSLATRRDQVRVIAMVDRRQTGFPAEVVHQWVREEHAGAAQTAAELNATDVVILQHEYGIFGGPDGEEIVGAMSLITVPVITVFHTVLEAPTANQRFILEDIAARSDTIVTMTTSARHRLVTKYRVDAAKVVVIPHGADETHLTGRVSVRANSRPTILTWGLLGSGKGIEWGIGAMSLLGDLAPAPLYKIVGKTHPRVLENEGEHYRDGLISQVAMNGLENAVQFDARYLTIPQLQEIVAGADIVLLPYDSRDQVTSGVLVEAVTAGKPVISTRFPHAIELLSGGMGILVERENPRQIANAIRRLLAEPDTAREMASAARRMAPELLWSAVAEKYRDVAARLLSTTRVRISA